MIEKGRQGGALIGRAVANVKSCLLPWLARRAGLARTASARAAAPARLGQPTLGTLGVPPPFPLAPERAAPNVATPQSLQPGWPHLREMGVTRPSSTRAQISLSEGRPRGRNSGRLVHSSCSTHPSAHTSAGGGSSVVCVCVCAGGPPSRRVRMDGGKVGSGERTAWRSPSASKALAQSRRQVHRCSGCQSRAASGCMHRAGRRACM